MIKDYLSEYCEIFKERLTIIRSIVIDNHEIAWMRNESDLGCEKEPFVFYKLYCECDFKRGVGWDAKNGEKHILSGHEKCLYRQAVKHLRHLELRQEYFNRFEDVAPGELLYLRAEEIIFDLIEKVRANEFIGEDDSAMLYDGYFHLPTLGNIINMPMNVIWKIAEKLVVEKKISLQGNMVQDYREPLPPSWEEYFRIEKNNLIGIAYLPGHYDMRQQWKLEILKDNIECQEGFFPLSWGPEFGPDIDDIEVVRKELLRLMELIGRDENNKLSIQDMASYLEERIDLNTVVYLTGENDKISYQIAKDGNLLVFEHRLRCVYTVVKMIADIYGEDTATSWLFGKNRMLEDAPVYLIRSSESKKLFEDIVLAARAFISNDYL